MYSVFPIPLSYRFKSQLCSLEIVRFSAPLKISILCVLATFVLIQRQKRNLDNDWKKSYVIFSQQEVDF